MYQQNLLAEAILMYRKKNGGGGNQVFSHRLEKSTCICHIQSGMKNGTSRNAIPIATPNIIQLYSMIKSFNPSLHPYKRIWIYCYKGKGSRMYYIAFYAQAKSVNHLTKCITYEKFPNEIILLPF